MKEQFVTYPIAKQLKKLGFDNDCFAYFNKDGKLVAVNKWDRNFGFHVISNKDITDLTSEIILAPLWQQVQRWLREKHNLHVDIQNVNNPTYGKWMYEINKLPAGILVLWNVNSSPNFDTYEEALEASILITIELILNKISRL
jgi:hypothetical protein